MRLPQTESCYRNNFLIGFTKQKCHNNTNSKKTQADWDKTKHLTKENLKNNNNNKKKNRNIFVLMLLYL